MTRPRGGRHPVRGSADVIIKPTSFPFRNDPEPLPSEHPFWAHPRVFLTPHVASMTQPGTAAPILL